MTSARPALDARARATITAAVERVVPSDSEPGAREAGTARYVLARAAGDPDVLGLYESGAADLDRAAGDLRPNARFTDLDRASQDAVLARLEERGEPFFRRLVVDTLEGFYGDPVHGGNDGGVSWRLLGFPGPTAGRGYDPPLGWYDAHEPHEPHAQS